MERRDNYALQAAQAQKLFLTYEQQELIARCRLKFDSQYLYATLLHTPYRICRSTGAMARCQQGVWVDANSFGEVMVLLDWLCDSRPDRYITGRWVNILSLAHNFHTKLQEDSPSAEAALFDREPEAFCAACRALGGEAVPGADLSYAIELLDGLQVIVQLWRGDEEFPPRLRCLWDENTTRYIRYETTWYAQGLLLARIKENM